MEMSTVNKILEYLNQQRVNLDNLDDFTTVSISEKLILSRTSTSEYLNSLVKDEKAVRIKSRPVYYLPVNKLEEIYNLKIDEFEFLSIEAFKRYLDTNANYIKDFDYAIGCNGSLMMSISSLKSAISYPTPLPVIIFGKKGTGMLIVPGMTFTIEPMINMGKYQVYVDEKNGWTVLTEDGLPSAQWEHTILITETGNEILTW